MNARELPKGIKLRKDGRYEWRFMVNGVSYSGYTKTISDAKKEMNDTRYEVEHHSFVKPSKVTVDSWFDTWMETYKETTIKATTADRYRRSYKRFIQPEIGKMKLEDVQSHTIQSILNNLQKEEYSGGQAKICFCIFKGMFTQALKNQMILHNPADAITLPRFEKKSQDDKRVMTQEEQKIFMEYAKGSVYYPFYVVAIETGMRVNEICGLQWSDIDFDKKEIHVSGTLVYIRGGKGRVKGSPKTKSSDRRIPMLPDVEKVLRECRKAQMENRLKLGAKYKVEQDLPDIALTYPEGGAFWDTGIRVDIKNIVERINSDGIEFEAITPHTFRHSFATRCAEQGMPLQVLKTILGHSSLAMTADLYSHVLPDTKQEELRKISNFF